MDFADYQKRAVQTAVYSPEYKLMYPAIGLGGEVGEFLNKVKKVYRDGGGKVTDALRELLALELGDCLWYLSQCCEDLGLSMQAVAEENLARLADRRARGTIHGSGDDR